MLGTPAFAATPVAPKISATQVTFSIPPATANSWTLRLWSHGSLEGSANGTSGMLEVAVPATSDCAFQADVTVTPADGERYFYSGARATVPGCGPRAAVAGHIFLCNAAGAPTSSEVAGGTLAATGPQTLASQSNPLAPTDVPPGTYAMTATSPSGYVIVRCGGSVTVGSSGTTGSEAVVVPSGGVGVGTFYVVLAAPTGSLSGGSGPPTSPGISGGAKTVVNRRASAGATPVGSGRLAFTGLNTEPLLLLGLVALTLGTCASSVSRVRRRRSIVDATISQRRP